MSQLEKIKLTIPGIIAGALTRTLGNVVLNSPAVKEITKQLPPVIGNIFVSGALIAITEARKSVTTGVSSVTQSFGFNRQEPLTTPKQIGE